MNVLDLFSGIGGFSLGLERAGMNTVAFCEIEEYCQHVLAKNFPARPIFRDIKTLTKERLSEIGINQIDIVTGGFPCQPFSIAGKKRSTKDDRDLWPEMLRVIKETRPTWVIGENVANFLNLAFARTRIDLEGLGYNVRPFVIPACAVGAQHRRDRVWIIAHLDRPGLRDGTERMSRGWPLTVCAEGEAIYPHYGEARALTNAHRDGLGAEASPSAEENNEGEREGHGRTEASPNFGAWWSDQSPMGRDIHGVSTELDPDREDRVAALGNTVIPAIVEFIGRSIMTFRGRV